MTNSIAFDRPGASAVQATLLSAHVYQTLSLKCDRELDVHRKRRIIRMLEQYAFRQGIVFSIFFPSEKPETLFLRIEGKLQKSDEAGSMFVIIDALGKEEDDAINDILNFFDFDPDQMIRSDDKTDDKDVFIVSLKIPSEVKQKIDLFEQIRLHDYYTASLFLLFTKCKK